ncbi:MAG: hypothetical protein ACO1NX_09955 [Chitinophagaceae bacterium]
MSSLKNILLICVPVILLFNSCTSGQKEDAVTTVRFDNSKFEYWDSILQFPQDSIKRDIPEFYAHYITHTEREKVATALNIGSLENGFSGEQIRIQGNAYDEHEGWERLIVFTKKEDWQADVYYIRYAAEDDLIRIIDSLQYQKYALEAPVSGWNVFMDSLRHHGLYTLPDHSTIPGYIPEATHEIIYTVEISDENTYRIYSYLEPVNRAKRFPQAKKFASILELIKRQFSFPMPQEPKTP